MVLAKQEAWHIREEDIYVIIKGFIWTIIIKLASNREPGGIEKGDKSEVVEIRTKAKSFHKKLDKM